jgi:hypothetical protein
MNLGSRRSAGALLTAMGVLLAVVFAAVAAASAGQPRFYAKYPKLDLSEYEVIVDHTGGYTHADCRLDGGNQHSGWLHIRCVGNVHESGVTAHFKLLTTPQSCSRLGEVFTVPGVGTKKKSVIWPHYFFSCKP